MWGGGEAHEKIKYFQIDQTNITCEEKVITHLGFNEVW